jgi:hypothetical protein
MRRVSCNKMKHHQFIILLFLTLHALCCSPKQKEVEVTDITLTEDPETRAFINFWKEFSLKFNSLDIESVKKITLDSIWLWDESVSSTDFIKRYSKGYLSSDFPKIILDTNKTSYSSIGCHPDPPVVEAIKREYSDAFNCRTVAINDTMGAIVAVLEFSFLETTKGYRLMGMKNYSYDWSLIDPMIDTMKAR